MTPKKLPSTDVTAKVRSIITYTAEELARDLYRTCVKFGDIAAILDPALRTEEFRTEGLEPELNRRLDLQLDVTHQIAARAEPYIHAALTRALEEYLAPAIKPRRSASSC